MIKAYGLFRRFQSIGVLYLAPVGLPRHIVLKGPSAVRIDDDQPNLMEFWPPYYTGQVIKRGRLRYQDTLRNNPRDPEFCRWADRVLARVRRSLTYNKSDDAYIGMDALDKLASGAITQRSALNENSIVPFKETTS